MWGAVLRPRLHPGTTSEIPEARLMCLLPAALVIRRNILQA